MSGSEARPPLPPLRDDGLPTLDTGEPVLARWFVIVMLLLVPVAIGVSVIAWQAASREPPPAIERRSVGTADITTARGDALFPETEASEPGPGCEEDVLLTGDRSAVSAARRALSATCQLIGTGQFPLASAGLTAWLEAGAVTRVGTFERSGVDASARDEGSHIALELNARYLFEDATRAAPVVMHQLALIGRPDWPGTPVSAQAEAAALAEQLRACSRLSLPDGIPRPCRDAQELLAIDDLVGALIDVGFRDAGHG
jgi:hypothetical protein